MAGERVLHKIQYGKETNHGTAVVADTMLLGEVTLPDSDRTVIIPGFGTGERIPGQLNSAFVRRILANGVRFATPADRGGLYYQLLPLIWSASIVGAVSPAAQTSGQSDYLWTHAVPLSAVETIDSFTLEAGDDARAYELAYCMCPEWELAGNADSGEVTLSATLFGDQIAATTFTNSLTAPSATYVIGKLAKLYVNASWATLGNTEFEATLLDWQVSFKGGVHPKLRGSGQRVLDSHGQGEVEVTLSLGLERTTAVAAEEDYFLASTVTPRFVRLEIDSGIDIAGTTTHHKITLDFAGAWVAWQPFGKDQDGNNLNVATLRVGKDATGSQSFTAKVITNVASI